ncbi:Plant transposon protein [Fragilaria crotonensis]|nr:Plant transposon protein [Fragilaria crotonensis]
MQSIRDGVHDVRPIDEWACYNENGTFNDDNFQEYLDQEDDEAAAKKKFMNLLMDMIESASSSIEHELPADTIEGPPMKRSRHVRTFKDPTTGVISPMTPHRSLWWMMYIQDPKVDDVQWNRLFRKRFRLPYDSFLELLRMLQPENFDSDEDDMFIRWRERNDNSTKKKTRVSPIELLLLGSLRYLGRGWTFDDLEESTFIARDVHRVFFTSLWNLVQSTFIPSLWSLHRLYRS